MRVKKLLNDLSNKMRRVLHSTRVSDRFSGLLMLSVWLNFVPQKQAIKKKQPQKRCGHLICTLFACSFLLPCYFSLVQGRTELTRSSVSVKRGGYQFHSPPVVCLQLLFDVETFSQLLIHPSQKFCCVNCSSNSFDVAIATAFWDADQAKFRLF